MGGVHPRGQNVVRLGQHGGGHNGNCGDPYFDANEVINDARLTSIIPREEIQAKVDEATRKLQINKKRCCMQTIPLIFIMVVLPQMFRFLEPASVVCNRDSNSKTSTEGCYVECCPNDNYDEYVAERDEEHKEDYEDNEGRISKYEPMKKCTTNFTEVEYYTKGYVENGEKWHKKDRNYCNCPEYIKPGRYRDKKANERHRVCKGYLKLEGDVTRDPGSMWLVALFIPMVIGSFCLIFYIASSFKTRMESQLKEIFSPWAQRGIYISYFPKRKHSQATWKGDNATAATTTDRTSNGATNGS
eukprot:g2561.t1